MRNRLCALSLLTTLALGCAAAPPAADLANAEQQGFWASLQALCGRAFQGHVVQDTPGGDDTFSNSALVMHVRECGEAEIRIPFHVGEDRSRTWVLTRTDQGLRLKHDHRRPDGTPDEVTQYGGDTGAPGTAEWQEFPADTYTATLLPAAATNVWTVEVIPDTTFAYALRREGTERRFRVQFDLTRPVAPPPAPWGSDERAPE
jgi:hypothetical protein